MLLLNDAINYLHNKAINGRVRDVKNEKVKIDYFRALIYAINTANSVYKDKQIDKLVDDLEMLKKGLSIKDGSGSKNEISGDEISDADLNELINFDERIKKLTDNGD